MDKSPTLKEQSVCALLETDVCMILYDAQANISYANPAFCELLGYSVEELQQLNIADFDVNYSREQLAILLQEEGSDRIESEIETKTGDRVNVEVVSKSHWHEGKRYFSSFILDITQRKQIETELQKARLSVDHAANPIIWYSDTGDHLYVNQKVCTWLGYEQEELLAMNCLEVSPMMTPERSKELFEICEREGTVKFESMKQAKDGTIFPVDVVGNFYCIDGQKVFCTFIRDTTEIKASLKQLRLNQFGVDSARDAIFWLTSEGQIKYANNAASRFFLTSCEDLVQLEFSELEPGLTESNWKERLELCRETKTHHHESRLVRTDGEMFDAEMHFNLLYFEGEELLLVSIKDVTQSKIENKSLMQFRHVIDQVPDSITLTNEQGVVVDANQAHCRRLGYDKHELVGQSISLYDKSLVEENGTCLAPESFKAFKADATGKHFFETIQTTKNGEEQHVEIRSTKIAVDGETFICSVIRDITTQKLGREQTERQLGLTVEAVDRLIDAMFWHDEAGNFIYVNDRACESLGYTRDELLQMNVGDVDPVVAARMVAFPGRGFPAAPFVEETEHKRKDGTCFPAELRVSKLTSGRESIYCAVARDLTDLKATEKRMSELSSQVAHLNRVGSMGQMASAMAHELNQPLAAISNNAFMLQGIVETEMPTDTDALMIAKDIGEQAVMSGQIVHRLRGFITDSSPCRELSEVNQIVVDSAKLIQHRLRHSKVSVQTDLFEGIPLVSVDRIQLQQVVVNLLGNALEAIEESDSLLRSIVVRTHYEELSDTVKIEIEDSGGGVEEEMMDRLFEPFYSTKDAGMGMGLAISRSIVISHGGTLDFTSDEYGTIFCIELPTKTSVVKV